MDSLSHILNNTRALDSLKEDLLLTLQANPGLRFREEQSGGFVLEGNFYIESESGELIDYFDVKIKVNNLYPYCFPDLYEAAGKIKRISDNHIDANGLACVEFTYIAEHIAKRGIRLFHFVNYYVKKYFTWHVIRKFDPAIELQEWEHSDDAKSEFYGILLGMDDAKTVVSFIEKFILSEKVKRNEFCYCGSGIKLKNCHYQTALFLKEIPRETITKDLRILSSKLGKCI